MSKRFRGCDLNQPFLLPPSPQDWLPQGHLARFVGENVPRMTAAGLRELGHDVKDVRGTVDEGTDGDSILAEQSRCHSAISAIPQSENRSRLLIIVVLR